MNCERETRHVAKSGELNPTQADHLPLLFALFVRVVPRSLLRLRNPSPLRKMFKRVEKKLARRRKEEELGITEEIKEAIGLNDVDSDDSSSDESEASSSSSSSKILLKRKRLLDDDDDELDSSPDADSDGQGSDDLDDPEDDEDEPGVQMTVEEALHDPLHIVSIQPDIRGCIVCPRKLLKNDTMVSVHIRSQVRHAPTRADTTRVVMEIS